MKSAPYRGSGAVSRVTNIGAASRSRPHFEPIQLGRFRLNPVTKRRSPKPPPNLTAFIRDGWPAFAVLRIEPVSIPSHPRFQIHLRTSPPNQPTVLQVGHATPKSLSRKLTYSSVRRETKLAQVNLQTQGAGPNGTRDRVIPIGQEIRNRAHRSQHMGGTLVLQPGIAETLPR